MVTNVNMTSLLITVLFLIYNKDLIKKKKLKIILMFAQIFQHSFTNLSKMIWKEKFSPIHNLEHNGLINTFYFMVVL